MVRSQIRTWMRADVRNLTCDRRIMRMVRDVSFIAVAICAQIPKVYFDVRFTDATTMAYKGAFYLLADQHAPEQQKSAGKPASACSPCGSHLQ